MCSKRMPETNYRESTSTETPSRTPCRGDREEAVTHASVLTRSAMSTDGMNQREGYAIGASSLGWYSDFLKDRCEEHNQARTRTRPLQSIRPKPQVPAPPKELPIPYHRVGPLQPPMHFAHPYEGRPRYFPHAQTTVPSDAWQVEPVRDERSQRP